MAKLLLQESGINVLMVPCLV